MTEPEVRDPGDEGRVEQPKLTDYADNGDTYIDDDSGEPESIPEDGEG